MLLWHTCRTRQKTPRLKAKKTKIDVSTYTYVTYGVATISRLLKILGLFCRISSLLQDSFAKETYNFKAPTHRSHPIRELYSLSLSLTTRLHTTYIVSVRDVWIGECVVKRIVITHTSLSIHTTYIRHVCIRHIYVYLYTRHSMRILCCMCRYLYIHLLKRIVIIHTCRKENCNYTYVSIYTYDIYTTRLHTTYIRLPIHASLNANSCRIYRYLYIRLLKRNIIIHMCRKEDCHHAYVSIYTYDIYTTRLHTTCIRQPLHASLKEKRMSYV